MSKVVGKKLRQAREEKNISLAQAADATHIRLRFIEAMEDGNFGVLPSQLQIKGFLRSYGGYLGLDAEALIAAVDLDPWAALEALSEESSTQKDEDSSSEADSASSFTAIGEKLKSQRELLGLSLVDVEQHTHLRHRYLVALESGAFDELPSPVQGRGMLKNYATFLGLDSDQLLFTFADGLQARLTEDRLAEPAEQSQRPRNQKRRGRRLISREILIGVVVVVFLAFFVLWGISQINAAIASVDAPPTPPSIADVLLPSSSPTLAATGTPTVPSPLEGITDDVDAGNGDVVVGEESVAQETQVIVVSENLDGAVQVQIVIKQRAWMRITVDGDVEFDGRAIPGSAYAFAGEDSVEISTGNGAGLQVFYNDLDLGTLGTFGEVVNFVITSSGIQTPTPTITLTPSPTETEEPTITPTP